MAKRKEEEKTATKRTHQQETNNYLSTEASFTTFDSLLIMSKPLTIFSMFFKSLAGVDVLTAAGCGDSGAFDKRMGGDDCRTAPSGDTLGLTASNADEVAIEGECFDTGL